MSIYADLRGGRILVTGGASGIGAAIVRAFHAQNACVFYCDTDAAAGRFLAKELGEGVSFTRVDLSQEAHIVRWVRQVARGENSIQVLVNNAAHESRLKLESMSAKDWDDLFATNVRGYSLVARETAPHMIAGAGTIINLASAISPTAKPPMGADAAAKGAALGFTQSLAFELRPLGIRVNTVSPGWVLTEGQSKQSVSPSVMRLIDRSQCVPGLLRPQDIADVVLFLASNASRAITGQEILADRGWAHL